MHLFYLETIIVYCYVIHWQASICGLKACKCNHICRWLQFSPIFMLKLKFADVFKYCIEWLTRRFFVCHFDQNTAECFDIAAVLLEISHWIFTKKIKLSTECLGKLSNHIIITKAFWHMEAKSRASSREFFH